MLGDQALADESGADFQCQMIERVLLAIFPAKAFAQMAND